MKRVLTLTIYEYPAAFQDIIMWENRFASHISGRDITDGGQQRINILPKKDYEEIVYCIPSYIFYEDFESVYRIMRDFKTKYQVSQFNKLLLFGSFPHESLADIAQCVDEIKYMIESETA